MTDSEYNTIHAGYIRIHQDTQVPLYSAEYVCTQHRIAVLLLVLVGFENSARGVVGVGRLRPVFYVMCYVTG